MIKWLIRREISKFERQTGQSAQWLHEIAIVSNWAALKVALFLPLSRHNDLAPAEFVHVARIAATRQEDCGPCLQIAVDFALAAGIARDIVAAAAAGDLQSLPAPLADICCYSDAVSAPGQVETQLYEKLCQQYGSAVMTEIALAVASVRFFPMVKRALGHAQSCQQVQLVLPGKMAHA